jgi:hypothetical protein
MLSFKAALAHALNFESEKIARKEGFSSCSGKALFGSTPGVEVWDISYFTSPD